MTTTSDDLVTVAEAAKILHRSTEQVRRYLREGKLPGERIGGQWFIRRSSLQKKGNKESVYQQRMELLKEVRELREQIYVRVGELPSGSELVEQVRTERDAEIENHLS